jgi:hypothetical protein
MPRDCVKTSPAQIGAIVSKMKFFGLPATVTKPGRADPVEHKTTVADGGRTRTIYSNDSSHVLVELAYGSDLLGAGRQLTATTWHI